MRFEAGVEICSILLFNGATSLGICSVGSVSLLRDEEISSIDEDGSFSKGSAAAAWHPGIGRTPALAFQQVGRVAERASRCRRSRERLRETYERARGEDVRSDRRRD